MVANSLFRFKANSDSLHERVTRNNSVIFLQMHRKVNNDENTINSIWEMIIIYFCVLLNVTLKNENTLIVSKNTEIIFMKKKFISQHLIIPPSLLVLSYNNGKRKRMRKKNTI